MIAILTPSRGLIFARTMESIVNGMEEIRKAGHEVKFYTTWDLPIPNCFNKLVGQAIKDGAKRIIFIEEDMYVFPKPFLKLAETEHDILTMQYNDKNGSPHGIVHYNEDEIIWAGLGATSVNPKIFEELGEPYFRTHVRYRNIKKTKSNGKVITEYEEIEPAKHYNRETNKWETKENPFIYGGQDIDFYTRARRLGYKVTLLETDKAHHFDLVELGKPHINAGCHVIRQV